MYKVYSRVPETFAYIKVHMKPYLIKRGQAITNDKQLTAKAISYTEKLLDLKSESDELVKYSFQNDIEFQKCRDEAFQLFMNESNRTPNCIAAYCNDLFIKKLRGASDDKTNELLDDVVNLFQCLVARDLFLKKYGDFLAKRLLEKNTASDDAEEKMISKLQIHCGPTPLIKVSGMRKDMNISNDLFAEFKTKKDSRPFNIELDIRILSAGNWPSQMQPIKLQLPKLLISTTKGFKDFYTEKFAGRLIRFLSTEGNAEIEVLFASKN